MKRPPRRSRPAPDPDFALSVNGIYDGGKATHSAATSLGELAALNNCKDVRTALVKARAYYLSSWFVESMVGYKIDFANFDLRIKDANGKAFKGRQAKQFEESENEIRQLVEDVWREWFIYDNAVAFWRDDVSTLGASAPFCLHADECFYSDAMRREYLKVFKQWSADELKALPDAERKRYQQEFVPSADRGEHFKVLVRGSRGYGFAWPRLYRVFQVLGQMEGMEAGEFTAGQLARRLIDQHHIGWEPKSNTVMADKKLQFYSKQRKTAIESLVSGKLGLLQMVMNFDHKISLFSALADDKLWSADKWNSPLQRLREWAGPLMLMLNARGVNTFLMPILRTQMLEERRRVATFLQDVIFEGWGLDVTLKWSSTCFTDPRVATELLKAMIDKGGVSNWTGAEHAGTDPESERERKQEEADLAENPKTKGSVLPLYDEAHGNQPGATPDRSGAGRTPGTPDPA
jgi:hypothetical protein